MNTRRIFGIGFCVICCMLPQLSAAVSGCTNGFLMGNYDAQVSNMNLQNVLQAVNSTGTTVTPATTPTTPIIVGFGSNPRSLSGTMPGTSRFFFDGNGTIVGQTAASNGGTLTTAVGTYNVNVDCTATISF